MDCLVDQYDQHLGILGVWGMSRKVQWSGVLLAAALPMAILQSTSTQNDLLAAAMMLQSVYWAFRVRNGNRQAVWWMLTAFSLAVFTKGSNYIYLLPVLPFAAIWVLRQFGWSCWKPALFGLAVLLVLMARTGCVTTIHLADGQAVTRPW